MNCSVCSAAFGMGLCLYDLVWACRNIWHGYSGLNHETVAQCGYGSVWVWQCVGMAVCGYAHTVHRPVNILQAADAIHLQVFNPINFCKKSCKMTI